MFDRPQAAKLTFIIYCTTLCLFDLVLLSSLWWRNGGVTCDKDRNEWRPQTLIVVDSLQGILLVTIYILMLRKKREVK